MKALKHSLDSLFIFWFLSQVNYDLPKPWIIKKDLEKYHLMLAGLETIFLFIIFVNCATAWLSAIRFLRRLFAKKY